MSIKPNTLHEVIPHPKAKPIPVGAIVTPHTILSKEEMDLFREGMPLEQIRFINSETWWICRRDDGETCVVPESALRPLPPVEISEIIATTKAPSLDDQ